MRLAGLLIPPIGLLFFIALIQLDALKSLKTSTELKPRAEEIYQQIELDTLKLQLLKSIPTFGFSNIFANLTLLEFIQYFGSDNERTLDGYSLSPKFFEVIVEYDPRFTESYLYLTNTVSIYAGQPQKSIDLMSQGLSFMLPNAPSRSFFVWRYKGTDEMLFTSDSDAAQKSFQTSADWAEQSSHDEAKLIAELSQRTANFLATNPNSKPALIHGWMAVLSWAIDDNVRSKAISQIEALGGEVLMAENGQVTIRYNDNE